MSRRLPVVVLDHAAEALFASHFAWLDRPGAVECGPMRRAAPILFVSRLLAVLAGCVALCLAGHVSASCNLVFDGVHAFQYDAFGRVIQINRASLPANAPREVASLVVGGIVKHYTYDAFGRLIRVQSPFPDPESGGDGGLRVERLYYDGLRRVQEVIVDPVASMNMAMSGESGLELQAAATTLALNSEEELDGSATPAALESQSLETQSSGGPSNETITDTYLAREYVWGPGDWGVDELLAQYDTNRRASWPLQDAGGDVIALCDLVGGGGANAAAQGVSDASEVR